MDYYLQRLKQRAFSDDLKKLLEPTTNISNSPETIPTTQDVKEIFMSEKEKDWIKKYFQ